MKGLLIPILFALGTALCWGMYGPALGNARSTARPPEWSPFKPYVFIGVAYLVIAIAGGLIAMKMKGDTFSYSGTHAPAMRWGFIAGSLGAAGAFFLTNAVLISKGNTALVMPIVFGGAVSVNALFAYSQLKGSTQISPLLWVGMSLVVVGVVLVAMNTPHGAAPPAKAPDQTQAAPVETPADGDA
ncbi:MAG: hypothetical protein KDA81_05975 [Planctomycetaceae bacterium]|nr:hypothetical protein [Planctomycetaceae bacterium]